MAQHTKQKFWDRIIAYSPLIALLLVWMTNPIKALNISNHSIWIVGITALPALFMIIAAFIITIVRRRSNIS